MYQLPDEAANEQLLFNGAAHFALSNARVE
jgi:hypothetical protein